MLRMALLSATLAFGAPVTAVGAAEPRPFLEGLSFPTNIAFLPDSTMLFTEKETGNVRVVTPRGDVLDRPFITIPVIPDAERGLLGIATHPDLPRPPWVYLYYSDPADGLNRLVRVEARGRRAAGPPRPILDGVSAVAGYHNGGDLAFAADGTLFVSVGEAHEPDRAQDPADIGGKILRLTDEGAVPADNPFGAGNPVWSLGHRNSFGLCIDPATGALWSTENGPSVDDEVNAIEAGGNYGWPAVTGQAGDGRFIDPVVVFPEPLALTGCAVLDGDLWFGAFDGTLWRLPNAGGDHGGPNEAVEVATLPSGITDVTVGPDGLLYVATVDSIWTLEARSSAATATASAAPGDPTPTPTADEAAWRSWVASTALVVLLAAVVARFLAGRRLGRDDTDR